MERYSSSLKLKEIKRLAQEKQYLKAMKILETMNIDKIRNMSDLSVIAEILIRNDEYEDAMEILLRIYEKSCTRRIVEQLIDLSIKMKNMEETNEFYNEYLRIAPRDPYRLVLRYRIEKANHVPYVQQIKTLVQLKEEDYMEEWAYELAKLYHKTGQVDKCVDECSDIILWFGQGIVVEKARLLKEHYTSGLNITDTLGDAEFDATKSLEEVIRQVKRQRGMNQSSTVESKPEAEETQSVAEETEYVIDESKVASEDVKAEEGEQEPAEAEDKLQDYVQEENLEYLQQTEATQEVVEELPEESSEEKTEELPEQASVTTEPNESSQVEESGVLTDKELQKMKEKMQQLQESDVTKTYRHDSHDIVEDGENTYAYGVNLNTIFQNFINNGSIKKQLLSILGNMDNSKQCNNFMVCGDTQTGKTSLARAIAIAMWKLNRIPTKKVAKISASKLNQINLIEKMGQLEGGSLVVENASLLNGDTVKTVIQMIKHYDGRILVLFEDTTRNMEELMMREEELRRFFTHRIILPRYNAQDITDFAYSMVKQQEYEVGEDASEHFAQKVEQICRITPNIELLARVKAYVGELIKNAESRNMLLLMKQAKEGRFSQKISNVITIDDIVN